MKNIGILFLNIVEVIDFAGSFLNRRTPALILAACFDYLHSIVRPESDGESLTRAAVRLLRGASGSLRVEELARRLGYSSRYLYSLFTEHTGLSPKELGTTIRFIVAYRDLAREQPGIGMGGEGYFDQAHLNCDFPRYAGLSPGPLLAQQSPFSKALFK